MWMLLSQPCRRPLRCSIRITQREALVEHCLAGFARAGDHSRDLAVADDLLEPPESVFERVVQQVVPVVVEEIEEERGNRGRARHRVLELQRVTRVVDTEHLAVEHQ